jgi:hypothetical protein
MVGGHAYGIAAERFVRPRHDDLRNLDSEGKLLLACAHSSRSSTKSSAPSARMMVVALLPAGVQETPILGDR